MKKLIVFLTTAAVLLAVSAGFAQMAPKPKPITTKPVAATAPKPAPKPAVVPIHKHMAPKPAVVQQTATAKPAVAVRKPAKPKAATAKTTKHVKAHRRHHRSGSHIRKVTPKRIAPKPAAKKDVK